MAKKTKAGTREIDILLIRTQSLLSRVMHIAARGEYTHVSIGMESGCTQFYSFAGRYPNLPLYGLASLRKTLSSTVLRESE